MAERKGPEGERPGHETLESGQQDDRSHSVGERNDEPKGTGSTPDHGDGAAARAVTSEETPEPKGEDVDAKGEDTAGDSTAELPDNVLSFRPPERTESADSEEAGAGGAESAAASSEFPAPSEHATPSESPVSSAHTASSGYTGSSAHTGESGDTDDDPELLEQDELGESVDLTALRADDALLDALGGTDPEVPERTGNAPNLEELLVSWRRDIDSAPAEELVDVDQAVEALEQAKKPQRRGWFRRRHLVPVATAAAVLMIGCTGVGVAARDALPGDMLWGVAQVFYSDHARAVQAATSAREDLRTAETALDEGRTSTAESALRSAHERMGEVDDEHGLSDLRAAHRSLTARVEEGAGEQEPTAPPQTSSQEPPSSSVTTPPSSDQEKPPPPTSSEGSTTPPTSSGGSTTPPTSSSDPSGTSESSTSDPAWDPSNPFFSGSGDGDQPSS